MYNQYYGFQKTPFNLTPDPSFLFMSDKHREALNHLLYGILNRKGFMQLTGEIGSGKTTICRHLLAQLDDRHKTALILNPCLTAAQLLRIVTTEFSLQPQCQDRLGLQQVLNSFLLDQARQGNNVVLIIDEAQNLTLELLEQVRLLSNLETDQQKLLQILLIGQPELREKLDHPNLKQLRQRITVRYHLKALSRRDMAHYIQRRIHVAGGNGRPSFSPRAIRKIYRYSQGIPRVANALCDMTLLAGYVSNRDYLTPRLVRRAIKNLEGQT